MKADNARVDQNHADLLAAIDSFVVTWTRLRGQ